MRFTTRPGYACAGFPQPRTACARLSSPALPVTAVEPVVPDHDAIRCDACPVLCYIKPGRTGSCDRYGNQDGKLVRLDPHVVLDRSLTRGESVVPFAGHASEGGEDWDGNLLRNSETFITAIGAGTTYPD